MGLASCLVELARKNASQVELDALAEMFYEVYASRVQSGKPQNAQAGELRQPTQSKK
jgi:hypothetical protein